jgi:hypothetical protein
MQNWRIRQIARAFRAVIESTPLELRLPLIPSFPTGACGVSSALLGAYFEESGISGFQWISGVRDTPDAERWETHVWLQRDSLVVDITADQFPDAPASGIVGDQSEWHDVFERRRCRSADFRKWDACEPEYERLYAYLKPAITSVSLGWSSASGTVDVSDVSDLGRDMRRR